MNKVVFSHKSDLWKTPKEIYDHYIDNGYFDPCPSNPTFNGLEIEWKKKNFVNPPYSQISKWVDKAIEENQKGKLVVLLVPSRTDTKWFQKLWWHYPNSSFEFIAGRLHFNESKNGAPFPSVIIILD